MTDQGQDLVKQLRDLRCGNIDRNGAYNCGKTAELAADRIELLSALLEAAAAGQKTLQQEIEKLTARAKKAEDVRDETLNRLECVLSTEGQGFNW
jgi:uncharacterized protein YlxW (UPF0749 family)